MKKGLTLLELLVVVGLISLILGSIIGVYISGIRLQRRILETQEALNQINYVLEYMGRAIRMAKKDDIEIGRQTAHCCPQDKVNYCQINPNEIQFRNSQNQCPKFYFFNNAIYQQIGSSILPLTSTSSLIINYVTFTFSGSPQNDQLQPRVTIFIQATTRSGKTLYFQTTVSQRDLDVQE